MKIGMIGLGRMGKNMAKRLLKGGHDIVAYNRSPESTKEIVWEGAEGAYSIAELVGRLKRPRAVWLMIPAGKPVEETIGALRPLLSKGDVIVDGGNSFYADDIRREEELKISGISYMDVGVSGGIWGLEYGYCLMIGGEEKVYRRLAPVFRALAPKEGYLYCGPAGAGHFVKMVHNGIEYGMMAAYGEGFGLLKASPYEAGLDFAKISHLWNQGSVIRSWLLELCESAFRKDRDLSHIKGYVEDSGEGRWMTKEAIERGVSLPVIALSLFQRFRSRETDPFSERLLAALRSEFGGHPARRKESLRAKK